MYFRPCAACKNKGQAMIVRYGIYGTRLTFFLIGLLLLAAPCAYAHKVTVFAWVQGDTIHTESKFSGGKHVQGGTIEVYDPDGNKLLEGTTDEQGRFSFPVPGKSDLKIVLAAGSGHSNHWVVHAEELGGAVTGQGSPQKSATHLSGNVSETPDGISSTCPNAREIEQIVQYSLDQKLAPLRAQLADPAWGFRDIVAGIGYILGLMGLAAYIQFRKQSGHKP
jgi:nickel transport protein